MHAQRVDIDLGVIDTDGDRIVAYHEKPRLDYEVSMGIYAYDSARSTSCQPRAPASSRISCSGSSTPASRSPGSAARPTGSTSARRASTSARSRPSTRRPSDSNERAGLDRLRATYAERDAASDTPYRWDNPGYVTYMQAVERALLRGLADAGVQLSGARVLDVGCGGGYFLHRLVEYGAAEGCGIDLMETRIESARERYPGLEWRVGSATDLPFADGSFDLVTQFTCLSSIVDDEARAASAREMLRVAGPEGGVLSFDMRRSSRPGAAELRRSGSTDRSCGRCSASRGCCAAQRSGSISRRWPAAMTSSRRCSACCPRSAPTCSVSGRAAASGNVRVCLVFDCLYPHSVGGGERWYRAVAEGVAARGHDVTYLTLLNWDPATGPEVPGVDVIAVAPEMPIYAKGRRSIGAQLRFAFGVFRHLARHGGRYDVVQTPALHLSLLAVLAARPIRRFALVVDWFEVWRREYWLEYLGPVWGRLGWLGQRLTARTRHAALCFSRLHARAAAGARLRGADHGDRGAARVRRARGLEPRPSRSSSSPDGTSRRSAPRRSSLLLRLRARSSPSSRR